MSEKTLPLIRTAPQMKIYLPPESPAASTPAFQYRTDDLPDPVRAIRYYMPVEICLGGGQAGLYHFCCHVYPTNAIAPVGYCAEGCPGHSTKEEAREHYRRYLIDRFGRYQRKCASPSSCSACGQIATHQAWVEYHNEWETYPLCQTHMNNAGLRQVLVFKDYYLLQISDPREKTVATVFDQVGPISVVRPPLRVQWTGKDIPDV
jgi:hypothetical protein